MKATVIEQDTNRVLFSLDNEPLPSAGDLISYETKDPTLDYLLGETFVVEYTRFIYGESTTASVSIVVSRVRGE